MTTSNAPQIQFMEQAGMPLTTEATLRYTEIVASRRLAYVHLADFIPEVEPYDVAASVDLEQTAGGVRMVLRFDAMHSDEWTQRAVTGWESELGKLERVLAARAA